MYIKVVRIYAHPFKYIFCPLLNPIVLAPRVLPQLKLIEVDAQLITPIITSQSLTYSEKHAEQKGVEAVFTGEN
jgi:hypothetical protein